MGPVPLRHLLGHQVDVGNQPLSAADHDDFLAGSLHGRHGRCETVAALRIALGSGSDQQPVAPVVPTRVWTLWLVPPMAPRPPLSPRRAASFAVFSWLRPFLAGPQPRDLLP